MKPLRLIDACTGGGDMVAPAAENLGAHSRDIDGM
jgi:hypothetical protein